jgi:hypothetical protein
VLGRRQSQSTDAIGTQWRKQGSHEFRCLVVTNKLSDALVISSAYQKRRFFCFSHLDPLLHLSSDDKHANEIEVRRDIWNEPPAGEDRLLADGNKHGIHDGKDASRRFALHSYFAY